MSLQQIRIFGDPVLKTRALPVTDFDKELRVLVRDLTETMLDAPGAGLAAPQIGVSLRVFTYCVDGVVGHLINPDLDLSEELQDGPEGCLSLPGLYVGVKRPAAVKMQAWNEKGRPFTTEADGLLARVMLHEYDHLDGILFIDRLSPAKRERALGQYLRMIRM